MHESQELAIEERPEQVDSSAAEAPASEEGAPEVLDAFARVNGEPYTDLPKDLYIPPDALEVVLEAFEGPLDLLLYLIRRQNLDILNIPVAQITRQYMAYIEFVKNMRLELAAEYLVMAALLGEIKSRSLLPRPKEDEGEEEDPRVELIRRLQEYERYKKVAEGIEALPRMGRDTFSVKAAPPAYRGEKVHPDVDLREVLLAFKEVLTRADMFESHHVAKEALSTRERMSQVLSQLNSDQFVPFVSLFKVDEGRLGVVVTFLAILELVKESLLELVQNEPFAPIHVRAKPHAHDGDEGDEGAEGELDRESEQAESAFEVERAEKEDTASSERAVDELSLKELEALSALSDHDGLPEEVGHEVEELASSVREPAVEEENE